MRDHVCVYLIGCVHGLRIIFRSQLNQNLSRMKKLFALILSLALILASAACAETADGPVTGGWAAAADPTVTDEVKALLEKGLEGLLGVTYEPVLYLGSQVVAGRNHAILCKASVVTLNAIPTWKIVFLYEDLEGNVSILNIADFDFGSLCTYGAE